MKTIKLCFVDFSVDFIPTEDYFYKLLSRFYDISLDEDNPDYIIYSCYGYRHLDYRCIKIFYTAENIRPDFNLCDYAIGFDYMSFGDRYLRFPNYARYGEQYKGILKKEKLTLDQLNKKSGFCNFVYSNAEADPRRDKFFHLLSKHKKVDSPGLHLNNMSMFTAGDRYAASWRESKVEFQKNYKFTIAFENSSTSGYTTEKIMHAFAANSVPIYWGNPDIGKEFNQKAFINCHEYKNFEQVVERVQQLDCNDNLYLDTVNTPCFIGGEMPYELSENAILEFFRSIFRQSLKCAHHRPRYGTTLMYENNMKLLKVAISKRQLKHKIRSRLAQIAKRLITK